MSRKTAGVANAKSARLGQLDVGSFLIEHKLRIQGLIVLMRRYGFIGRMRPFFKARVSHFRCAGSGIKY